MSTTEVVVKVEVKLESNDVHHIDTSNWKVGQKFPTPSPGNGDRVFYESLLQQKPDSEMAQEWCLAYGVLPEEQAKKLYAKVCSRKGIKPVVQSSAIQSPVKKPAASGNGGRKRKVVVEGDLEGDDDLGASAVWEERGRIGV